MSPCASLRRTMIPNDFPSGGLQQSSVGYGIWYLEWRTYGTVWIGRCAMVLIYSRISCLVGWFDDSCQICWYDMILPYLTWVQMNWLFLSVRQCSFGRHDGPQGLNHLTFFRGPNYQLAIVVLLLVNEFVSVCFLWFLFNLCLLNM